MQVTSSRRGVVGVNPPGTVAECNSVPHGESVTAVRVPPSRAVVEIFEIGLAFGGRRVGRTSGARGAEEQHEDENDSRAGHLLRSLSFGEGIGSVTHLIEFQLRRIYAAGWPLGDRAFVSVELFNEALLEPIKRAFLEIAN